MGKSQSLVTSAATRTVADFAEELGVGRSLFFEAKRVHEIFAKDEEYRALMEPRILAEMVGGEHEAHRPVGLGAVIAGWGGRKTLDQARKDREQLELFTEGWGRAIRRFSYWAGFDPVARREALGEIRKELAGMEEEERKGLAELLRTVAKEAMATEETPNPKLQAPEKSQAPSNK